MKLSLQVLECRNRLGANRVQLYYDLQLVVSQAMGEFESKDKLLKRGQSNKVLVQAVRDITYL